MKAVIYNVPHNYSPEIENLLWTNQWRGGWEWCKTSVGIEEFYLVWLVECTDKHGDDNTTDDKLCDFVQKSCQFRAHVEVGNDTETFSVLFRMSCLVHASHAITPQQFLQVLCFWRLSIVLSIFWKPSCFLIWKHNVSETGFCPRP
jgi:hypothetical protein